MSHKIRAFGVQFQPWHFAVVAAAQFVFAATTGVAWFPRATPGSGALQILISAQAVSFTLLIVASAFFYSGMVDWQPTWKRSVLFFVAAILGSHFGDQLLPLLFLR